MYVIINNSAEESIALFCYVAGTWEERQYGGPLAGGVLGAINTLLQEKKYGLDQITGLGVLVGQGRFTATRLAVTAANTLAYALNIPVIAFTDLNFDKILELFSNRPLGQLISATYSGEANIGKKSFQS